MKATICASAGRRIIIANASADVGTVTVETQGADRQRLALVTLTIAEAELVAAELQRAARAAEGDIADAVLAGVVL